jgi:hypothetical protein
MGIRSVVRRVVSKVTGSGGSSQKAAPTIQYSGPIGPNPAQSTPQGGAPRPSLSGTGPTTRSILGSGGGPANATELRAAAASGNLTQAESRSVAQTLQVIDRARRVGQRISPAEIARNLGSNRLKHLRSAVAKGVGNYYERSFNNPIGRASVKGFDFVSGGYVQKRRMGQEQKSLNKEVEKFNERYGGKDLSESEYERANKESARLNVKQINLEDRSRKFQNSKTAKFGDYFWGTGAVTRGFDFESNLRKNKQQQKEVKRQLAQDKGKKGISSIRRFRNQRVLKGLEDEAANYKARRVKVFAGDVPFTPARLPGNAIVKFVGRQSGSGNKIKTDIVFVSRGTGERIGRVKGVTVIKGRTGFSVAAGRSGRPGFKFPSRKATTKGVESFIGREVSRGKRGRIKIRETIQFPGGKAQVTKSLKALRQLGVGQVATVRGLKFQRGGVNFPSSRFVFKKARGINLDTFATYSRALTRKDLSLIMGKTITGSRNRAKFIGIIKQVSGSGGSRSVSSGGSLSRLQKRQFKKAFEQVIGVASAAISKVKPNQSGRISASTANTAAALTRKAISKSSNSKQVVRNINKTRVSSVSGTATTSNFRPRLNSNSQSRSSSASRVNQALRTLSQVKSVSQTKQVLRNLSLSRQRLRQALRSRTLQRQVTQQVRRNLRSLNIAVPSPRLLTFRTFGKSGRSSVRRLSKAIKSYHVYAKSGRKFVKVSRKPLSKLDALNAGSFAIDNTTAKTFKIVSAGKRKQIASIPQSQKGYYNRMSNKFREFRIRRGRKFSISPNRYIEKRRYGIDTRGEKKGLTISRFLKQRTRYSVRPSRGPRVVARHSKPSSHTSWKNRYTATQKAVMLRNLAKGRAKMMRMRNR